MPNDDLISRKDLLFEISTKATVYDGSRIGKGIGVLLNKSEVLGRIEAAPAVDAEPVRHAQWVTDDLGNTLCSNCKSRIPYYKEYDMDDDYGGEYDIEIAETNYCPNCGAKMDKEE